MVELNLELAKSVINRAKNSEFYKNKFAGIEAGDIKSLETAKSVLDMSFAKKAIEK